MTWALRRFWFPEIKSWNYTWNPFVLKKLFLAPTCMSFKVRVVSGLCWGSVLSCSCHEGFLLSSEINLKLHKWGNLLRKKINFWAMSNNTGNNPIHLLLGAITLEKNWIMTYPNPWNYLKCPWKRTKYHYSALASDLSGQKPNCVRCLGSGCGGEGSAGEIC